ncbi:other/RAN protein kinase [Ephemerocybe angulata]|uniref:Other/RAN protein kinase n=1 Tax=Ephemerocybe angulata TaxID=980116 RepID=A0A8H6MGS7_9AGAR|nr:other/RAN protein kinase [Tulosesus angulatus]
MASKTSPSPPSATHPPLGTLIDGDSLELVEVLGVGGYGVVYRAVDARYPTGPKSYAVKCLVASGHQTARQRQIHIREIALHQLASAHPGVVTLHRVVEHFNHTYIIMDYAPDHDLFTQILHNCRYLGNDALIKDVFLQMLDSVEYCHSLGIYHRDLKPENILCFEDGLRVAITDFGLATTDKISDEFRTGSVYHMSPECQGGAFAPGGKYSPMFNDIWSLGIILLNLATGRNPWKSATADDPTFQAYLRDPYGFLPTVLPISPELNEVLIRMLNVDWRKRMNVADIRYAIEDLTSFYSDGVVFEGSMARCPWEAGMDIDSASSEEQPEEEPVSPHVSISSPVLEERLTSHWSKDSTSDIIFAGRSSNDDEENYGVPWPEYSSSGATWAFESPVSSNSSNEDDPFPLDRNDSDTASEASTESPTPSLPTTPNSFDMTFSAQQPRIVLHSPLAGLTIDTNISKPRIYQANTSMERSYSAESDMMHTAIEYDPYSSLFFLSTPISAKLDSAITAVAEDKEMISPSVWRRSYAEMSSPSEYSDIGGIDHFARSASPSPEPHWPSTRHVESSPSPQCQPSPASAYSPMTDIVSSPPSRQRLFSTRKPLPRSAATVPVPVPTARARGGNSTPRPARSPAAPSPEQQQQQQSRFAVKQLFPRATPPAPAPAAPGAQVGAAARGRNVYAKPYSTFGRRKATVKEDGQGRGDRQGNFRFRDRDRVRAADCSSSSTASTADGASGVVERVERKRVVGRRNATRHWFMPGKLFSAVGVV